MSIGEIAKWREILGLLTIGLTFQYGIVLTRAAHIPSAAYGQYPKLLRSGAVIDALAFFRLPLI